MEYSERVLTEEDAFDRTAMTIAEVIEKIMGTDEEAKERERINEEVFQKNISHQLNGQFHLSFDKMKDFSKLEKLTEGEKIKTLECVVPK